MAGLTITALRIPTSVSAAADRPASYGNQIVSSTRPSCYIQLSTVGVINIAADHQMFMTLTGEPSWQRLRRSPVDSLDLYSKSEKIALHHRSGHLGVTYELHLWLVGKPVVDFIFVVIELFSLSPTVETLWVEICRSRRFSKGGGSLSAQISELRESCPPTTLGIRVAEWLPFRVV